MPTFYLQNSPGKLLWLAALANLSIGAAYYIVFRKIHKDKKLKETFNNQSLIDLSEHVIFIMFLLLSFLNRSTYHIVRMVLYTMILSFASHTGLMASYQ